MRFLLLLLPPLFATAVPPVPGNWEPVPEFSDEFDSVFDQAKWWDFNPQWPGRKPGLFARENVSVSNGCLRLEARVADPEKVRYEDKVRGYDKFTTSIIKSKTRIKYGYFEARAKGMNAAVCNAFWLYDPLDPPKKYKPGAHSEEIDIFEFFGKLGEKKAMERVLAMTVHRFETPYVESIVNSVQTPLENKQVKHKVDFDFHADFHTYGFLWTPKEMKWYLDGREVFSRTNDYYHTALHVMLDCEIMQGWVGLPDPADLPAVFQVDHVRVWRNKNEISE